MLFSINWQLAADIATAVSGIALTATAVLVLAQLRQASCERYFSVTSHLFEIWQSPEFQRDQLFLLHKLSRPTWEEFCALGRGDRAEQAIHRVGGYYDRVGNLVLHGLIRKDDILPTIGGYAIAVWHRIEPLVKELRLRENAVLFQNYEALLPECCECYVPGIGGNLGNEMAQACAMPEAPVPESKSADVSHTEGAGPATSGPFAASVLDTAHDGGIDARASSMAQLSLRDSDGVVHKLSEFLGPGPAVLVYARGAWCPYCLRQLSDYAEHYPEFKHSGIEVFAVSPESSRRSRRMRIGLNLPFTVLLDSRREVARILDLMGHEKKGEPTPATIVLDGRGGVRLSSLNQGEKCLLARDMLEYARALSQDRNLSSVSAPQPETPKPGFLWAKALMNMTAGLVVR